MAENLSIRKIVDRVINGEIRIPAFQRDFVWTPDQVSFLLDSILKNFPIGTIFLWKTSSKLETERELGNFTIPEPRKEHPVYYVLDGQQRITSLFSVFQSELQSVNNYEWLDIYYDFNASEDVQENKFIALQPEEADENKYFPMSAIFDPLKFYTQVNILDDEKKGEIVRVQRVFQEYSLPVQEFETDSKESIAIVFERINRAGTPLNTFQLLTAWSWSADFDLQEEFTNLSDDLKPFGFGEILQDKDLLLKCCSGIIKGSTSPKVIISLTGDEVRTKFDEIKKGIKGAIEFLREELKVHSLEWLPYPSMIISLSSFFSTNTSGKSYTDKQRKQLVKWFWRSNFSRRYQSGIQDKHRIDIEHMRSLSSDENKDIANFSCHLDPNFFIENTFRVGTVNTKTFVLMLSSENPKSFISGSNVRLGEVLSRVNRNEFHHIFPKKYLERKSVYDKKEINCLANFCFLNNADNQKIKDKDPKTYKSLLPSDSIEEILESAICPINALDMDFRDFIEIRSKKLAEKAEALIN